MNHKVYDLNYLSQNLLLEKINFCKDTPGRLYCRMFLMKIKMYYFTF